MAGMCKDCEFFFPREEFGFLCADAHYGENIADSLEVVKDCYSEGLSLIGTITEPRGNRYETSRKNSQPFTNRGLFFALTVVTSQNGLSYG